MEFTSFSTSFIVDTLDDVITQVKALSAEHPTMYFTSLNIYNQSMYDSVARKYGERKMNVSISLRSIKQDDEEQKIANERQVTNDLD